MTANTPIRPLRLAMVWNQAVQGEAVLSEPRAVTLGYSKEALFPLPEAQAARGDLTLLSPLTGSGNDGYSLHLPPEARGAVWIQGTRHEVQELLVRTPTLTLGRDDYGVVSLGPASYFFQQVEPTQAPKRPLLALDGEFTASLGLSLFIHVCVILLMLLAERELPVEKSLELPPDLIARFLVSPPPDALPETKTRDAGDALDQGTLRQRDEGGGKKEKSDPGKAGKPEAQPKAPEAAGETRGAIVSKVRGMGLLGALAGGDTLRDALNVGSVGDLLSGLNSSRTDVGAGSASRGLRGAGTGAASGDASGGLFGGGGLATGAGAGAGAGRGTGRAGGAGAGTGPGTGRGEAKVQVTPGTPQVSGELSAEQIERVVRANQAALRYCYETELQRQRALKGKVLVQWRVDRAGLVPSARVTSSTLNNSGVEGCIVRQIRKWRFPKPNGGEVNVIYPFLFGVGS